MQRKICIINHKGGVGKTTTTVNLGSALSRMGKKVLLIDLDSQGNIAHCLPGFSTKGVYELLMEAAQIKESIIHVARNFDMIPSDSRLSFVERHLYQTEGGEFLIREALKEASDYDYILIDCPPSRGMISLSALLSSTEVIIPTSTDFLGYEGLKQMIESVETVREKFMHAIMVSKIVPTMFDKRNRVCQEVFKRIQNEFPLLATNPIRTNSKLREAPKWKMSIFSFDPKSNGAQDYWKLAKSVYYDEEKMQLIQEEDTIDDSLVVVK